MGISEAFMVNWTTISHSVTSVYYMALRSTISVVYDGSPLDDMDGAIVSACRLRDDVGRHGLSQALNCYNLYTYSVAIKL